MRRIKGIVRTVMAIAGAISMNSPMMGNSPMMNDGQVNDGDSMMGNGQMMNGAAPSPSGTTDSISVHESHHASGS